MRIPSGSADRFVYFVAVDATDLKTRETGLTGFTVYRSRDGGAAAAFTTPTVNETDSANMPGVYELLIDEDTTIGAAHDTEEFVLHITQASMSPVTRVIELYRPETTEGNILDVTATGAGGIDWGNVENPTTVVDLSGTDINLVDTTTTNTDMRGTDSALLAASAPTNFGDMAITATTGRVDINVNNDKAGYSISGAKTTLDSLNDLTAAQVNAEVDTALDERNLNDLIQLTGSISDATPAAGNFDGNAGLSATDDFYNGMILVFTSGTLAGIARRVNDYTGTSKNIVLENSFPVVPTNGDAFSIIGVEVMPAAPAGTTDWTSGEKENIRSALGVTGTKTTASGGQLQDVKTETDKLTLADAGAGVAGSIIEEIENRATPTDVDTQVDARLNTAVPVTPTADSMYERLKRVEEDITPTRAANLDSLDAAVSTRATPAQVNTEVVDALTIDTHAEPASVPAATASLKDKIAWLFALARNKITQTSTTQTLRNDADAADIGTSSVSDDGTTATRDEWV